MGVFIKKEEMAESVSQSPTSFKSPQDRRGEKMTKAEFELLPPSETQSLQFVCLSLSLCVSVCVCVCVFV